MKPSFFKIALLIFALGLIAIVFSLELHKLLTLSNLQSISASLTELVNDHPTKSIIFAFCVMFVIYSLPLPAAALMSLTAGYVFNFSTGLVLVLSSSLLAATLTFLIARYIARDWLTNKFSQKMAMIDKEVAANGFLYALSIRMVPGIPFIMLNAGLGLTMLTIKPFTLSTLIGMLPISAVLVNAGSQFNDISSISDVLTPTILFSLLLLAAFPFFIRFFVAQVLKKQH